jgi:ssRNA-specific RNase YbeY (16S rRNA maturation enzyme)
MNQISERVQEELSNAASHVRNALSFASRTEKPVVIRLIGDILISIENITVVDQQYEAMESLKNTLLKKINNDGDSTTL